MAAAGRGPGHISKAGDKYLRSLLVIGACTTSTPGVTNVGGTYRQLYASTPGKVIKAAEDVLTEMKLIMISSEATDVDGRLVARTAEDRKVEITVVAQSEDVCRVSVRAGGDEETSVTILDKIRENL